ncbi:conserved hypothetical protein [Histoplasma capsulatum H143]|uniref:Vesicle tethering protein Uso1/P115-like head domain-containing protein n=1 Tax=Ajellomyces capsulatus (strain H143) TaxID=544712 RepID=C6HCG5_AJECH|nr:conserved hypothetical protein [Histoplasma capsulatum H143]
MFRILESQVPARQTATDTINTLSNRLQSATLLEDRRAAILGLRSFAKEYPASVSSGALRPLINSLRKDAEDVDTIKVVLETLLMLFSPNDNSPEASDEIALWLADEFTQRQDNITILLDLLDSKEFYSRLYSLQLMSYISSARPERTQECIFTAPLGISRLVNVLSDAREPVRNEALLLLIALTPSSAELQKLVAFENAFERIFSLIETEGSLTHGSTVVADCLSLLGNLLALNVSNQSYFRETGCVKKLGALLSEANREQEKEDGVPEWALEHRDKNLWGLLAIVQLFLVKGGISTPVNQSAFWQNGVMEQALRTAFNTSFDIKIRTKALSVCADLIRGNSILQEQFADIDVLVGPTLAQPNKEPLTNGANASTHEKLNVIEALLELTLESESASFSRCEARCFRGNADPYQTWLAAVLLFHLVFEDPEAKALAMKVTEGDESSGEEVITCVQVIAGNLITGMQRNDDERISVGYLMLLCGWLYEDLDVVDDFLGEGSIVQRLIQETSRSTPSKTLLPGLSAILLGIIYEFSTKDSPIPRPTLHRLLMNGLGREQYIDKITKLRELSLVRDFEVLPQSSQLAYDGLPEGISRELVDTLRAQVEDKAQAIQKLESDLLTLERKLEQEQLDHRKTKDSTTLELNRVKHLNETLQRNHEEEFKTLEERNKQSYNDLLRQHGEQLRTIDSQLKQTSTEHEKNAAKTRKRHEAEVADLKKTIQNLEASLEKAGKDHIQDLQTAHEEYSLKLSSLEARNQRAEDRAEEASERAAKAEEKLKTAKAATSAKRSPKWKKATMMTKNTGRTSSQKRLGQFIILHSFLHPVEANDTSTQQVVLV